MGKFAEIQIVEIEGIEKDLPFPDDGGSLLRREGAKGVAFSASDSLAPPAR